MRRFRYVYCNRQLHKAACCVSAKNVAAITVGDAARIGDIGDGFAVFGIGCGRRRDVSVISGVSDKSDKSAETTLR